MKKIPRDVKNNVIKDFQELTEHGKYKYNYSEIARKYDISRKAVYDIIKEYNLFRRNKITQAFIDNIIISLKELDDCGNYKYSYRKIAKIYGTNYSYIYTIAKENNLSRVRQLSETIINNIIDSLKELDRYGRYRYSYRDICEIYNVTINTVSKIAKENNLTRKI